MTADSWYADDNRFDSIERRVRLVLLLDASREAGLDPLPTLRLHRIAYLANVLSPVWDMPSATVSSLGKNGSVLKQVTGPFYPDLQADLDSLVGMGVAQVENLGYENLEGGRYRLEGSYRANQELTRPIMAYLYSTPSVAETAKYVRELVLALSNLSDEEIDRAVSQDATYGDPKIGNDNVIDFGEWATTNYSSAAAIRAGELVKSGVAVGASEKVHLYIRHLKRRLHGAR